MIKVAIIWGDYNSREGIKRAISSHEIQIVGDSGNGAEGIKLIGENGVDIVVLGLTLPDMTGIHACHIINSKFLKTKVIFLIDTLHLPTLNFLMHTSAKGFITLAGGLEIEAIKTVHEGGSYVQPNLSLDLFNYIRNSASNALEKLTPKEHNVLLLAAQRKTHTQISELCCISQKTAANLKSSGMKKLNIDSGDLRKLQEVVLGGAFYMSA